MIGRRQPARGPSTPPVWRVTCERWIIPALEIKVPAVSEDHARRLGVAEAHRRSGPLPPWRPLIRASLVHTTAERGR